jgi:hypothetical protein
LISTGWGNEVFLGANFSLPTEGWTIGKGGGEALTTDVLGLDLLGFPGTTADESVDGEEISPFATRELRRLESGAGLSAFCVGGGPGGKGGRTEFGT